MLFTDNDRTIDARRNSDVRFGFTGMKLERLFVAVSGRLSLVLIEDGVCGGCWPLISSSLGAVDVTFSSFAAKLNESEFQ